VVQMEPAGWSYDGLANTLHGLERYDEACAAHAIATRINPRSSLYWSNWAVALNGQQKFDDAIAKCERALQLQPTNGRAYWQWGVALDGQGKTREALEKCKMAKVIFPESPKLDELISDLQQRLQAAAAKEPASTLTKGE
jgi:tetratricopeptide (TPR) repeat protein